jgi:hypothetical protein
MGFDLFPSKMSSVRSSRHATQLKIIRFVSLGLTVLLLIVLFLKDLFDIFSIATWTALYALIFEVFAVLSYFVHSVDKAASVLFLVAWSFNATMIWLFVLTSILFDVGSVAGIAIDTGFDWLVLLNYLPFVILLVDFVYNKISFIRLQYLIPVVLNLVDLFFWYNDFEAFEYFITTTQSILLKVVLVVAILGVLELSRLIKVRSCKESEIEHSLL